MKNLRKKGEKASFFIVNSMNRFRMEQLFRFSNIASLGRSQVLVN